MAMDPRFSVICREVLQGVPFIESVIVCGSRATSQSADLSNSLGDYDVAVVMKAIIIPLYLRRIKKVEDKLSKEFGVKVNLNPLPTFRIRKAKGNLFLFKMKREGIVIWGKDYVSMLNSGSIEDIDIDCYFSYLSSLMKELARSFDPSFMDEFSDGHGKQLSYGAAKALLGCGELLLLLGGNYESNPKVVVSKLCECGHSVEIGNVGFLESLRVASMVKENPFAEVDDPLRFWFSARNCLLEVFRLLVKKLLHSHTRDLGKLVVEYSKASKDRFLLKNVEYSVLTFLMKKEVFLKALFGRSLVFNRMRVALIWLLAAVKEEDGSLLRERLEKANYSLRGYTRIEYSDDDTVLWRKIRYAILTYWPYACTVMGL